MALVLRRNQVGVKPTGVSVTVPEDCTAKLMYYLDCMCAVLNLENKGYDLQRLTNYHNYNVLTTQEQEVLLLLCLKLSPEVMNGKCIFLDEETCGDQMNKFFSVQAASTTVAAVESVVVGEVQVKVTKIMFYKLSWIQAMFFVPLGQLAQRLKNAKQFPGRASNQRPAITYGGTSGQSTSRQIPSASAYDGSNKSDSCCTIL